MTWAPVDTLLLSGLARLYSPRVETLGGDVPILLGTVSAPGMEATVGFEWVDSAWSQSWQLERPNFLQGSIPSPVTDLHIVGADQLSSSPGYKWLYWAQWTTAGFDVQNVAPFATSQMRNYTGAVIGQRRWVFFEDMGRNHVYYSDGGGPWVETPIAGKGELGVGMAPLDENTAVLAWDGYGLEGVRWGILHGTQWAQAPDMLDNALCYSPTFRARPGSGYWMGTAAGEPYVLVRSFRNESFSPPETLRSLYRHTIRPWARHSNSIDFSRDREEYPAIAWSFFDGWYGVEGICVVVPRDTGWTMGDQLENDEEGILPSVARDVNGDVWVAFWSMYANGIFWTHTHTKATSSVPVVLDDHVICLVTWTLSEPAPETWWAVLREQPDGSFASVARVRAEAGQQLSWRDESPIPGARYRIRRECVDTRYQWLSGISDTPVPALPSLVSAETGPGEVKLSWYATEPTGSARVARRTAATEWVELGQAKAEGNGLLTYVDTGLSPGRYAYQLYLGQDVTPPTWVDVPGFSLALASFQPNPAVASLRVAFTLASAAPARLEVFSVTGRRVHEREVGALGAGSHVVDLGRSPELSPGVYWVRLSQSGKSITAKGVLAH